MHAEKQNSFTKIGKLITKRKYAVLVAWLLILVLVLPFVLDLSGVVSLQMDTASDKNLESQKASDMISAQFASTVSNETLMIVVSSQNASSMQTQDFINRVINDIKANPDISNLENVTSIYTVLVPVLNQTNEATYTVYENANLTFNLLYGVPTAYMTVWSTAYNQTVDTLVSGLNQTNDGVYLVFYNANMTYNLLYGVPTVYMNVWSTAYNQTQTTLTSGLGQTNQGVYETFDNANMTYNLLYGVPATYMNVWSQVYNQTQSIPMSNELAYSQTADILSQADPTAFAMYTSHLLDVFNASWALSFQDPSTSQYTPIQRASVAADLTNQQYINNFLANNETEKAFATALTSAFSLEDFLTNTPTQNAAALQEFSAQFVAAASNSSLEFVNAAYNLGRNPSAVALAARSDDIIWHAQSYNLGQDFLQMFNQVSYDQTAEILRQADPESFDQYVSHLLDIFNAVWAQSLQNPATQQYTPTQRASFASEQTNKQYVDSFFAGNQTAQEFANALTETFSLQDFLTNTQAQNNAKLEDFALHYIANSSDASIEFVTGAYDLGKGPASASLDALAESIIWNPQTYNMGQDFIGTFNEVSYNQTATILRDVDSESFDQYTAHLLDLFDEAWVQSFQTQNCTPEQRATAASEQANAQYVDAYLGDNKDFGVAIMSTFSLQDFLANDTAHIDQKLCDFSVEYVSNSSGLSPTLISSTNALGKECSEASLQMLAGNIVCNPSRYEVSEQLASGINSLVSPSKDVTLISVGLTSTSETSLTALRDIIKTELKADAGDVTSALVTGRSALNSDFGASATQDLDFILPVTVVLLLVATGLFFKSIVTPLVTLGTIGVGLGISQIFVVVIGTYVNQVDFMIPTILLTVLLGVGTDYSIFIIARHREELVHGLSVKDALVKSVTWAGESIATSGTTVIISFLGLSATTMILLQTLGIIVGASVIVALLVSLTLVPALAAILGNKLFWPTSGARFQRFAEAHREKSQKKDGYFARSGKFSVKHAKVLVLVAILITVPTLYICATSTPTYDFLGGASKNLEAISASDTLSSSFGGGSLFPTYIVVTFSQPLIDATGAFNTAEMSSVQAISDHLLAYEGVGEILSPTMPYGEPIAYSSLAVSDSPTSDYNAVIQNIGADNKTALITLKFQIDPYSNQALSEAQDIRTNLHSTYDDTNGITGIYVGGTTGSMLDVKQIFDNQFNTILPIVTIGVGLVLFVVLGSLVLPVFAILSVLMSIVWTLAATILVFQSAFNYGLLFITPMILLVLLLGIGMDYNIFILTRIREESAKGQKLNDAIVHAIEQTGGIITAAAIILAGSLGALMLSSNLLLKEMGFAFAFSILIDALVVRTYLVPAVMSALGKWNWYNPLPFFKRSKKLYEKEN
ncbi:MAG: MMPL family transporter [Candidatus Bathyarchaeia archaeon]|jgi:RND superfamily putative drug exporter